MQAHKALELDPSSGIQAAHGKFAGELHCGFMKAFKK